MTLDEIARLRSGDREAIFERLLDTARRVAPADADSQWQYLSAAHIVGQHQIGLHLKSHLHMLRLSRRQRDWPEAAGQLFRLALVPLGHLFNRLPFGNTGRADVSAFAPMGLPRQLAQLIDEAQSSVTPDQHNNSQHDPTIAD
jgi:Protein of unknown function (DUF3703)